MARTLKKFNGPVANAVAVSKSEVRNKTNSLSALDMLVTQLHNIPSILRRSKLKTTTHIVKKPSDA